MLFRKKGKMMNGKKIRIIKKNDEYSMEYQIGDIFTVDGTWYGGVNVRSASGVPLSLDKEEYEEVEERQARKIDLYSYQLGVMDCLCEMVGEGIKPTAVSRKFDTEEERDSCEEEVKKLCGKYGILYRKEEKYFYIFFTDENKLKK